MYIKLMGALMILIGCGGYGMLMAMTHRREVTALHQLVRAMDGMICELEYRLTPLPELCRHGALQVTGSVGTCILALADALDSNLSPDVAVCTTHALKATPGLPKYVSAQIQALGQGLGRFDLPGQLTVLEQCKQACQGQLEVLEHHQTQRLRSYQTLGFCAGAALAILLF
jgi:stage III sporulation protein AB